MPEQRAGHTPFHAFLLAAPKSGEGKTTVSIALMRALARRGMTVQGFKCGPDYIDPGFHAEAAGRPSCSIDTWMMGEHGVRELWRSRCRHADAAVAEGVMGLFDSICPGEPAGSTADCARVLNIPVILVLNARGMAWSAAALVDGFKRMAEGMGVRLAGVIANNAGSPRHAKILADALEKEGLPPLLGALPRTKEWTLPQRQLGLIPNAEARLSEEWLNTLADCAEEHIDIDRLLAGTLCLRPEASKPAPPPASSAVPMEAARPGKRLGIAKDQAFCFYYQENERVLEQAGWTLVPFSPLHDKTLPENLDALYLGGGYPEVFAGELSANASMRSAIQGFAKDGGEIYAECGGFMYLCTSLELPAADDAGDKKKTTSYPMCNVLDATAVMGSRLRSLGYREASLLNPAPFGLPYQTLRGHEFHWSDIVLHKDYAPLYRAKSASSGPKECGVADGNVRAGYLHLYFAEPKAAQLRSAERQNARRERAAHKGQVILLNGPSSAGKTTLGKALQDKLLAEYGIHSLLFSIDQFLKAADGSCTTVLSCLEATRLPLIESFHACIEAAARAGAVVVADHVLGEKAAWVEDFCKRLSGIPVLPVQVACSRDELQKRELARKDRPPDWQHALRQHQSIHRPLPGQLVVDTTLDEPARCADAVLAALPLQHR